MQKILRKKIIMFQLDWDTFSKNLRNIKFYEIRGYVKLENIFLPNQSEYPFHCYEKII